MGGDPASAYLGWEFFRRDEWHFPLGANPTFGLENSSSIVYSDSLPLFAIPAKLFAANTSGPFQYFGLWLLTCFLLQGFFSAHFLGRLNIGVSSNFLGSLLACLLPFHLCRLSYGYGHFALFGHFVIVAGLILARSRTIFPSKRWALLLVACLAIHAYLFVMVAFLGIAQLAAMRTVRLSSRALSGISISFAVLVSSWILGYFELPLGAVRMSVGGFRADPTSPIRSLARGGISWSNVWRSDSLIGDGEGFVFLGLGALGVIALSLAIRFTNRYEQRHLRKAGDAEQDSSSATFPRWVYFAISLLAILSLRPVITLGSVELHVPLPSLLVEALNPFRANGRFLWPLAYVLLFASMAIFSTRSRRLALFAFSGALILQLVDTSAARTLGYEKLADGYNYFPTRREWLTEALEAARGPICSVRVASLGDFKQFDVWIDLADFALEHSLATNFVYTSRTPHPTTERTKSLGITSTFKDPFALHILDVRDLAELQSNPVDSSWKMDVRESLVVFIPNLVSSQSGTTESEKIDLSHSQCQSDTFPGYELD
jgi:hypothetical protein